MKDSRIRKRSLTLRGHRTSVGLEEVFWAALEAEARAAGISLTRLVAEIDTKRKGGLAGALRVHALRRALRKS